MQSALLGQKQLTADTTFNLKELQHEKKNRVYSRFFVQQSESLFGYFEFLRQPPLQSLHGLFQGQGELEACAGGGVDV